MLMKNMSDVFRTKYRELSDEEKAAVEAIKTKAGELHDLIEAIGSTSRYTSLAKTCLEESVMWAVKQLTGQKPEEAKQ